MPTTSEAIQTALSHHRAGRLAEAERIYRQVLAADPRHAGALHLLGLVAFQSGNFDAAVKAISQAIRLDGGQPTFHANLGETYRGLGRLDEARACYVQALRLRPDLAEAHNNLGTILQVQGQTAEAIACYEKAIALKPAYADAHNNLGNTHQDLRQWDAAIACYQRAAEVAPSYAKAHFNRGLALRALDRLDEARAALEEAVALQDNYLEARFTLATILQGNQQWAAAEAQYRRALEINPRFAEAYNGLGTLAQAQGKLDQAIGQYAEALRVRPEYPEAYYNWGRALVAQDHLTDAVTRYRQALACKPDFADAQYNLGTVLQKLNRLEEAATSYEQAIRIRPDFGTAHNNLGNVYHALGRSSEAVASFERALSAREDYGEALNNLGNVLQAEGHIAETVEYFERALEHKPGAAEIHNNLGNALVFRGESKKALECYQKCLELAPNFAEGHYNLALLYLSQERFAEGWPEYFWRLKCEGVPIRPFEQPLWQGEPLEGRTLLVHAEQGLGDTLQMLRYVPLVQQRGGRVLLEVQPKLVPLVRCSGFPDVLAGGAELPPFDVQVPILNLPGVFGTTSENMPRNVPYLSADPSLVAAWHDKLAEFEAFNVGIGWQGSRGYSFDRDRSIALARFAPLAAVQRVRLFSLQKYDGIEQLADVADRFAVHDLGPELDEQTGAFMDTAAVMKNLDLVVTSDTATAHLAGALGVPTWLALPKTPDWRWFLDREDSPWYPTMRLFRQREAGDWPDVFARIAAALDELARTAIPEKS